MKGNYSDKKNVLQLLALMQMHGIRQVVLCPGSRNSPLVHSFACDPFFRCYPVTDERSAGFFAIGLIQALREPVAVCCTSGSAVLNLAPAVAEAFYQELPLLILSADRPTAWVGQMDGQTLSQPGVFNTLTKKSVQLNEPVEPEEEWYCNRLINEAILGLDHHGAGPVQINIPLSEPLFNYTVEKLPVVRKINRTTLEVIPELFSFSKRIRPFKKPLILIGQMGPDSELTETIEKVTDLTPCVILAEHLSNLSSQRVISHFDPILFSLSPEEKKALVPDLVITLGGHIVSKRIKQLIRDYPPEEHWHITPSGEVADLFRHVTEIIETTPENFLKALPGDQSNLIPTDKSYQAKWMKHQQSVTEPVVGFSDIQAVGQLIKSIPPGSGLHLANSSSVRYAQLFTLPEDVKVFCNRGTSGIEGSVSTATGFSSVSDGLTFLITGDLSFFYDMNGIWNNQLSSRLRILLNNNGGGEIFHLLKGLNRSEALQPFITGTHTTTAKGWAGERGFLYLTATNQQEMEKHIPVLTDPKIEQPVILEVFSRTEDNAAILKEYYKTSSQAVKESKKLSRNKNILNS